MSQNPGHEDRETTVYAAAVAAGHNEACATHQHMTVTSTCTCWAVWR